MNKHLYRIIFNERRGQLMVVAANVKSAGKPASGEAGPASASGRFARQAMLLRPGCRTVYAAFGMLACLALPVNAQIVADPNAPGKLRPTVLETPNGAVLVNIQTPSSAGVSRNVYTQFDVMAKGAVLNNSRTDVQSQIGGWVQGNPWLAGGSARVILNEVNSVNPSKLNGYVEVAGQRAEVVIANPAGVSVDGGGFINASKVTITTGAPRMNGGSLEGYLVQRGTVTIGERGMDGAEADYVGILGRAVQVNGSIWAKELQVIGGASQVDASQKSVTTESGNGDASSFALDVAHLGGMYAGKITLIGTEAGVGMRNSGSIVASAGDLVLGSNGWLTNSGTIQATAHGAETRLDIAGDIINSGKIYAARNTQVESASNIATTGLIAAQNDTTVLATGAQSRIDADFNAIFASGLQADGTLGENGHTQVNATRAISFHGAGTAAGDIAFHSKQLDVSDARLFGIHVGLEATGGSVNASRSSIDARGILTFRATNEVRTDGAQVGANLLSITARDLFNVGGYISQLGAADLALILPGILNNSSGKIAANSANLTFGAKTVLNADGKFEHAGTGRLVITAEVMQGQRGHVESNGAIEIFANKLDHYGASIEANQVTIAAADFDNANGRINAQGGAVVTASAGLINTDGKISTGLDLTVQGGNVDNSRGILQAVAGDVFMRVSDLNNAEGSVFAGADLDATATRIDNSGSLYAAGDQRLDVHGVIANSGVIGAQRNTTVSANSLTSTAAGLLGAGLKVDGLLAPAGDLSVTTSGDLAAYGQNLAAGQATLAGASVNLSASQTSAAGISLQALSGNVSTSGATVVADGTLAVSAGRGGQALVNTEGTLSARQLDVQVANLDNRHGTIIQSGTGDGRIVLGSASGTLDNKNGRIAFNSTNLVLGATTLNNIGGLIEHAGRGALSIAAESLDGQRGQITGNGTVLITANDFNHDGAATSGRALSVRAESLTNRGGHLLQGGTGELTLRVNDKIDNADGEIAADGTLSVQTGDIDNSRGRFTSAASAEVASAGGLNNSDGVLAAANALTVAGQRIDNAQGMIQAGAGALALSAASLLNSDGTLSAGGDLTATVDGKLRNSGTIYASRNQTLEAAGALVNTGSIAAFGHTTIMAGSVDSATGALIGAGINLDGSVAQSGNLTVNATQGLRAAGQNLAAGDMSLAGASVDLSGSESGAANIAITATSGDVDTGHARVSTAGTLRVTANAAAPQVLNNAQGTLEAGKLAFTVANLNNAHGTLVQTGSADSDITLSTTNGTLDNTSGRIATNGANLTLGAGRLINTDGRIEHAGTGTLALNAVTISGEHGQITGNGALSIAAGEFDHRNAQTAAQQVTIAAADLDNRAGHIAQLGAGHTTVTATGSLDNSGGSIESNGDATIGAATLKNIDGKVGALGHATVTASVGLNNTNGHIGAGADLSVQGGDVENSWGILQAHAGDVVVRVSHLNNAGGSVLAGVDLDATATRIDNSGSLYAAGDQRLTVSGTIANSGVIGAQGNTTVSANSLTSTAAGLLGAGLKADGLVAQAGDLSVTTSGNLAAYGQNLAAGQATLTGASVDVSGSQTNAAGISLQARTGDVSTSGATVVANGTLAVSARSNGQALVNTQGTLSARQLELQVANLDNNHGTIIQSGTGDGHIALTSAEGRLDNSLGRVAFNSANLTLNAATLLNTAGRIEHAGMGLLNIGAWSIDEQGGHVSSNGTVLITANDLSHDGATTSGRMVGIYANSLTNRGGHLLQGGTGGLTLQVDDKIDNTDGEIAADGSLLVQAGDIDNSRGRFTSATSSEVTSTGVLNNDDGVLAAANALTVAGQRIDNAQGRIQAGAGALSLRAASLLNSDGTLSAGRDLTAAVNGELRNSGTMYAGRNQTLDIGGGFNNTGSVASLSNTTITAGSVDSATGALIGAGINLDGSVAQSGNLTVNATQGLRAAGQNLAAGDMSLAGASVDLSGSESGAANIAITATSGDVDTGHARVSTAGTLRVTANAAAPQVLNNAQGTLEAGKLAFTVANLNNAHGTLVQTGSADSDITLSTTNGTLDNTSGRIATNGANLTLGAGRLINTDGRIEHAGTGTLALNAVTISGEHGQITGNGALSIAAGEFDHRNAQTAAQQVTIAAADLDNRAGHIAQLGAGHTTVTATGSLDNSGGSIESNGDATIGAATLKNIDGKVGALGRVTVAASVRLDNTDGSVAAGADLVVLGGDVYNTRGALQAQAGDLSMRIDGLNNAAGSVSASGNLDATASHIDNSGSLYAAGNQRLTATDMIVNNGVIAAQGNTTVSANSLSSTGASLLGAGINGDGTLAHAGDLSVTTSGDLAAHGQNLAAGRATLAGASVDVSGSQTSAAGISLQAHSADVLTSGATVVADGTLAVSAGSDGQALVNTHGTLSARQLDLQVANLDNKRGTIIQSGNGDTSIVLTTPSGRFDNVEGRIAVNSANLALGATTLNNTDGLIAHAGTGALSIAAESLDGQRGQIIGSGTVLITANDFNHDGAATSGRSVNVHVESLTNRGGHLLQGGTGGLTVRVAHQLDNADGEIAADGTLSVQTGDIDNSRGRFTSAASAEVASAGGLNNSDGVLAAANALTVAGQRIDNAQGMIQAGAGALALSAASLLNSDGTLSAGGDLTATVDGELRNSGTIYASRNQTLEAAGALVNIGSIAAFGHTTIMAGSVDSATGALIGAGINLDGSVAQSGNLTVNATQGLRAAGQNLAAGDMSLAGASVDLSGSESGAANIAITATSGNVDTGHAKVSTAGTLRVTANAAATQVLNNAQGTLEAGKLAFTVANLNNDHGTLVQSGSADSDITLSTTNGTLDNTSGRIATNGANLTLGAGRLINTDGRIEHAGTGTLALNAVTISGEHGQITGNGALSIAAGEFDHRNAQTAAQQVTIAAADLDNRAGHIAQLGAGHTTVTATGSLDNSGGSIESNGDATIGAATLKNIDGKVGALGRITVAASVRLDNTDGSVAAGADLVVLGGDVYNTRGALQAQAGDLSMRIDGLNNAAGSVSASGNLDATASHIDNSGSLYAAGNQRLTATDMIVNNGVIAAQGNTTVSANSLSSTGASLLGAGIKGDGTFAYWGDLSVTTSGDLAGHGQNLAAGRATLAGASVDLSNSQTGAAETVILANRGNVSTSGATVIADGTLAISARGDGQALVNTQGTLSARQLDVQVANLDNRHGTLIQSGAGDTSIVLTSESGMLDNADGHIAVNSANLSLGAGTIANVNGKINHAGDGTLTLSATRLELQHGEIKGNGSLLINAGSINHHTASIVAQKITINATSLDNRDGGIIQLGRGRGTVTVSDKLDNRSGEIASNGDTAINAGTLFNQSGTLKAGGDASLDVTVREVLDNSEAGTIAAGTSTTLRANSVLNRLGTITGGAEVGVNATAALQNDQGFVAGGEVHLTASTLNNNGGVIAAVSGNTSAITSGVTDNGSGVIQAANDIVLRNGGLSNTQVFGYSIAGSILGRNIEIDTNGHALNNESGTIDAAGVLDVSSGALINNAGLLQAGTKLTVDTAGQSLSNLGAAGYGVLRPGYTGGIVSGGAVLLRVGDFYNAGGMFGAGGEVSGSTGVINNTVLNGIGGQIVSRSSINLTMTGLRNQGGQIQALGDLTLSAPDAVIDNRESLIRSGATLTLVADTVDNDSTRGYDRGLEGRDVQLNARILANNQGAIRADNDAVLNVIDSIDNTSGLVSAENMLRIVDPFAARTLAITNTGGTLIGGNSTNIHSATLTGDGQVFSLGDMAVNLSGDYVQRANGEITGNNNVSIVVAGDLSNFGKLRGGATLQVNARNIDNAAEGDMSASGTHISAAGVLRNRGLIDGFDTQLNAETLNNTGTGRIYGDHLSISAGEVNNGAEGGIAATIAARDRLDIGATNLNNAEHALIFSGGIMAIGGDLDGARHAYGRADRVSNASATIESLGEMNLSARQVNNLNNHFSTEVVDVGAPVTFTEYEGISSIDPNGVSSPTRYLAGTPGVHTYSDGQFIHLQTPEALWNDRWVQYDTTRTTRQTVVTSSDPGRIASGGNLTFDADNVFNDNSHILAGGRLSILPDVLNNAATVGEKITSESGRSTLYKRHYRSGADTTDIEVTSFVRPETIETVALGSSRVEEYTALGGSTVPGALATVGVNGATSAAGSAGAEIDHTAIAMTAASLTAVGMFNGLGADVAGHVDNWSETTREVADVGGALGAANGATAAAADRTNEIKSASHIAVDSVSSIVDSRHATAASGLDGVQSTDRARRPSEGIGSAASGKQAAASSGSETARSSSSLAVHFDADSVGERQVSAASGLKEISGSKRLGGLGTDGGRDTATGPQAAIAIAQTSPESAPLGIGHGSTIDRTAGDIAAAAEEAGLIAEARNSQITQSTSANPSAGVAAVRTSPPLMMLPNVSLYRTNPAPTARYLIETDERFVNYRQWLDSDYMLDQLQLDPSLTQKRLGDGYYEQSLIRAQVAQLTGQRYLGAFTSDDEEYKALMDAGVVVAKSMNLRPGVALSAAQMAALTDDIVWMVEKEVTLADGSVQKVLAPQVYARVREGDLDGSGTLLAGKDVDIRVSGNLVNSGTISGRNTTRLAAENVQNMGGRIHGDVLSVAAANDLNNIGGIISANSSLIATAGRDINVETTTRSGTASNGGNDFARTSIDRVAGIYVTGDSSKGGGTLVINAGRDINLAAAQIGNAGENGTTAVTAGRNLSLTTVGTASSNSITWGPKDYRKNSTTTEVGSQIQASGAIALKAGVDLNARAADVQAGKSLTVTAGNDINLVAGVNTVKLDQGYQTDKKGFLNSTTIITRDTLDRSSAIGTTFDGDTVNLVAGNDIKVLRSAIAGDGDVSLTAGNAVSIAAATDTSSESHHRDVKEKGFLSGGGGFGISYGTRTTTTDQNQDATVQSGQARSMVGSISGSLKVNAGDAIKIAGSDLSAGKDIDLSGKSVAITAGVDDVNGKFTTKMTQDALTLAIGGSVVNAIQTAQAMNAAGNKTSSGRHQALAAAAAAMTANDAAQDMAKNGPSAKISLTVGHSESESTEVTTSRTHGDSVLAAGNNVTIVATGADKASNIDILGSDVRAANNVSLIADNQVNLLAAQDNESQHSQSKSWSAAVGVAAEINSQGARYGITASASASKSNINGEGTTQVNSHVTAGERLTIASGGDTNLKGAVASGGQVVADVKGNLNIESLQDTAKLDGKSQSVSVSGTVGAGGGFSASFSQSKVQNDYASVHEQSGIRAGDGGFQVNVAGHTDLKGGVISSSERAIEAARNSVATEKLSFSDIENRDSSKASGISLGVNVGKNQSGNTYSPSLAPGVGKVSGSQSNVMRSGVSEGMLTVDDVEEGQAIAGLNRGVKTGDDTSQALTKSWRGAEALDDVGAQMEITSAAMPRLAKTIGDYAETKAAELNKLGNAEEAAKWGEGGVYRVAAHTALGALGGGASGALGAASTAVATPVVASSISKLDVPEELKSALLIGAGTAIGVAVGGQEGGVAGANEVANNYLSHVRPAFNKLSEQEQLVKAENECNAGNLTSCKTRDDLEWKSESRDIALVAACSHGQTADCRSAVAFAQQAGNKVVFGSNGQVVAYPSGETELVPTKEVRADSFHDKVSRSTSEGLLLYGTPTLAWKGAVQVPELGARAVAAYQQASAGYSLIAASGTGAVISGATYSGGAALGAYADVFSGRSTDLETAFAQRFSYSGLATATTVGAATGAYGTAMFQWAGVPNSLSNLKTLPGAIIRLNSTMLGQSAGRAAQGAVTPPKKD